MAGGPGSGGTGYRSALRHRDLRLLFGGLVVSATGSWAYNVALLAYVYDRTHSLGWVAGAGLARFVPVLLLSPYGGVVADRFERLRVMVGSDAVGVACRAAMAVVAAASGPPALIIALGALTAAVGVAYMPAVAATIPEIAREEDLAAANALNSTIDELVVILGPAVGAGLLAASSPAVVFGLNAATFALSALIVARMGVRSTPVDVSEAGEAGPLAQVLVGIRTIAQTPAA